ncbi:MAG: L,D-transpeptidase family protein [Bdellovibrio sp.]
MIYAKWKRFVVAVSMASMVTGAVPLRGWAYGEASEVEKAVKGSAQGLVPLIKPSWGQFFLRADVLNKLYSLRSYQAIWVSSSGLPNDMAVALKNTLQMADRHGLKSQDYWDDEVNGIYEAARKNPSAWIAFELVATEALLRYVTHLSTGRFDPEAVDSDIKFKRKTFTEFSELNNILQYGPSSLTMALDALAPSHPHYLDLMDILVQLRSLRQKGGWEALNSPGFALKKGVKDPIITRLRDRLNQMGYKISYAGRDVFDQEFDEVLRRFQAQNGLAADGVIGVRSEVLRSLNYSVNQRISQVEVTMEKLRWLPRKMEPRHIFVNLATTEFRLFDENGLAFNFKTVNGQPFRRTPSMRDQITYVNLNPYWTVPRSIAIKDKLPLLQADPRYLEKHNMLLVDEATDEVVDPSGIDWRSMTPRDFGYYIRQLPGPDNALGVVKFPLQNPWAIYMHDTNEPSLFSESKRHRSSGCVRLEQPLDLAADLLRDQAGWSLSDIKAFVPSGPGSQAVTLNKNVSLKKAMPVYFLYLTVGKGDDGSIRFVDDVYGQDYRLSKALQNAVDTGVKMASAGEGSLMVQGQPGRMQLFQMVKAVRCDVNKRGTCAEPVYFALNKQQSVPAGSYLVGFENSLYPEMVTVAAGRSTTLQLEKVTVPAQVKGQKIRIYRDFTALSEQQKIYLTMFAMNRHFFRLEKDKVGDLYLAGSWERDFVQRFTYETCARIDTYAQASSATKSVCRAWNTAQRSADLRELYNFGADGTFQEMWVTYPGDVIPSKHPRYLVSLPITEQDFVSVFPGTYKVQAEGKNMPSVRVTVGARSQNDRSNGILLNATHNFISLNAGASDCWASHMWKTEDRAYCTDDEQEGCYRGSAKVCEGME